MKAANMEWSSVFKIHSRYTGNFNKGRIFLAGDAAHVHTPAGGQGMNSGIQDAYNLAWKLSLVLKKSAKPELLNTFHEERFPIAKNLHKTTDRFFQLMIQQNKAADFFRMHIFPNAFKVIFGLKGIRTNLLRRFSQLAIKYRFSSLSQEGLTSGFYKHSPKAGDRAPYCEITLDGEDSNIFQLYKCTHFTLIIAVSETDNENIHQIYEHFQNSHLPVRVFQITDSSAKNSFFDVYGIKRNAIFIIRPDSHIAFRSSALDIREIEVYFETIVRSR
ncbi:MAG: FAD-dependent monooxygenase [Balneolaceae bacterium]